MQSRFSVVVSLVLLVILLFAKFTTKRMAWSTGDISFIALKADLNDGFAIVTFVDIPPNTTLFFSDSEWNGTRFGMDESTLIWNNDGHNIAAGTVIVFENINSDAEASYGKLIGNMNLSRKSEAIFAYVGQAPRQPTKFIAAVANAKGGFGTLINTGLEEKNAAIIYPEGTYFAEYLGPRDSLKKASAFKEITTASNYVFNHSDTNISLSGNTNRWAFNPKSFTFLRAR
ncbi:MAG: hypothetical protein AB3N14_19135 [Flavobacteriaceae bacterium]